MAFVFETLEDLKENLYCTFEDIPYILLIIAEELREIKENELQEKLK